MRPPIRLYTGKVSALLLGAGKQSALVLRASLRFREYGTIY